MCNIQVKECSVTSHTSHVRFCLPILPFGKRLFKHCSKITINYFDVAKCNLGEVNLESMCPAVFPTNLHVGWPQRFALPWADESALFAIGFCFAIIRDFL